MNIRKKGWYWVKVEKEGDWGCFFWTGRAWKNDEKCYSETMFDVVGPHISPPEGDQ